MGDSCEELHIPILFNFVSIGASFDLCVLYDPTVVQIGLMALQ